MYNCTVSKGTISISNKSKSGKKQAVIDIDGVIGYDWWNYESPDANTKEYMKSQLRDIAAISDVDEIIVNINSIGGDVNHGLSIHDLLAEMPYPVETRVNGMTASAATIIAQAGSEGRRIVSDNSLYLIHNAWTVAVGNKSQVEEVRDMLNTVDNRLLNIYTKRSDKKNTRAKIKELFDANNGDGKWITADEVVSMGLADSTYEPMSAAAAVSDIILGKLPKLPEPPEIKDKKEPNTGIMTKIAKELKAQLAEMHNKIEEGIRNLFDSGEKVEDNAELKALIDSQKELKDKLEALEEEPANEPANEPGAEPGVGAEPENSNSKVIKALQDQNEALSQLVAKQNGKKTLVDTTSTDPVGGNKNPKDRAYDSAAESMRNYGR